MELTTRAHPSDRLASGGRRTPCCSPRTRARSRWQATKPRFLWPSGPTPSPRTGLPPGCRSLAGSASRWPVHRAGLVHVRTDAASASTAPCRTSHALASAGGSHPRCGVPHLLRRRPPACSRAPPRPTAHWCAASTARSAAPHSPPREMHLLANAEAPPEPRSTQPDSKAPVDHASRSP